MDLILASASPRRAELLQAAGYEFEVVPADVDETPQDGEAPEAYTVRVARDKARTAKGRRGAQSVLVLAADTEVVVDGRILGKPVDQEDARRMLRLLSGRGHDVLTAVVLAGHDTETAEVAATRVYFMPLTGHEIDWYVASGEPMGKAGGYAIQGRGARFIERIEGSWSSVVGLPVATVHRLLREVQWAGPVGP
jgi:septum formation protein